MLLQFEKTDDCYRIIETGLDYEKTVEYKLDLSEKKCNNDPWQKTTDADRRWFEKYWREKFQ
jgi:hypothetical protein